MIMTIEYRQKRRNEQTDTEIDTEEATQTDRLRQTDAETEESEVGG